jgi:hypothetical protein
MGGFAHRPWWSHLTEVLSDSGCYRLDLARMIVLHAVVVVLSLV